MKNKYLMFVFLCFLNNAYCMVIPQYDRSIGMPGWEHNHLVALAVQYDGVGSTVDQNLAIGVPGHFTALFNNQFIQQFIACTRSGVVEDPNVVGGNPMNPILLAHAQNPVGREIMYRIMAKLEPRMQCVDSIRAIIANMDPAVIGNLNSLNICANLLIALGIARNDNAINCLQDLLDLEKGVINPRAIFNRLKDNPVTFISSSVFQCTDGSTLAMLGIPEPNMATGVNDIIRILYLHENALRTSIDALRFRLVFDSTVQDQYDPADNTITITGQLCNFNLITGPILANTFELTYVETQWRQLQAFSTLKHELGHYLRIGLENVINDAAFLSVGPALFALGVLSSEYIIHLVDIWDNSEELTEIFGVLYLGRNVLHDRLNQSDFNLAAAPVDGVRYSHRGSRFPLVQYSFFNSVFGGGGALPISNQIVIDYDKSIASI